MQVYQSLKVCTRASQTQSASGVETQSGSHDFPTKLVTVNRSKVVETPLRLKGGGDLASSSSSSSSSSAGRHRLSFWRRDSVRVTRLSNQTGYYELIKSC